MNPFVKPFETTPEILRTPQYLRFDPSTLKSPYRVTAPSSKTQGPQPKPTDTTQPMATTPKTQTGGVTKPKEEAVKKPTTAKKQGKSAEEKYQDQLRKEIQNAYQQQIEFLGGQEQMLQQQLPTQLEQIGAQYEALRPELQSQLFAQQEAGAIAQEGIRQTEQQNLAAIRRSAEEQGIRAVQQFGGVGGSSAAQAASELIGREQLRTQGAAMTQATQNIQSIQQQLRTIQAEYDSNVNRLNLEKERALQTARNEFNNQLNTIKQSRMQAGVTKANQTIAALQDFASRRRAIEDQASTLQNNLTLLKSQAEQQANLLRLQSSLQSPTTTEVTFSQLFPENSNQSREAAKTLQAIINSGRPLSTFGVTALGKDPQTGEDLYQTSENIIIDTKGNRRTGLKQQQESQTSWWPFSFQ